MPRYSNPDKYVDAKSGVLKNLLGIAAQADLDVAKTDFVAVRSFDLSTIPLPDNFDLSHLQAIHRHLFQEVYAWAGEFRTVDIRKGSSRFAHHAYIESAAQPIFSRLAAGKLLLGLGKETFCLRAAYSLGELNALHPFRGGNGRTQREFIGQLARRNGYFFRWKEIDGAELLGLQLNRSLGVRQG